MNKLLVIGSCVGLLVIGGVGFFLVKNNSKTTSNSDYQVESGNSMKGKSLKDLFSVKDAQECSFSDEGGNSGAVYISDGKMRGNFTSQVSGQGTIDSHIIVMNNQSYVWMEGQTTGFSVSLEAMPTPSSEKTQTVDLDQKLDFKCGSWSVNSSFFTLPTNVKFSDMSSLIKPQGSSNPSNSSQCAACDAAPADYQAQCKAALGCN